MTHTPTAAELLGSYLSSIGAGDPRVTASYFAEDGCIDAPYVEVFGMPARIVGPAAIEATMANLLQTAPNFRLKNVRVVLETPTTVVAEYESEAVMANGRSYQQLYFAQLTARDGKIVHHREFLNTVPFVQAFFPGGLSDLIQAGGAS